MMELLEMATKHLPNMDLMSGIENSVRMSKEKNRRKSGTRKKSARRKQVRSLTNESVNAHIRRIAKPHLQQVTHNINHMFSRPPGYYPAYPLQPQFNPSTVGYGAMSAPEVFSAGGSPCFQPIFYAISPAKRKDKKRRERTISMLKPLKMTNSRNVPGTPYQQGKAESTGIQLVPVKEQNKVDTERVTTLSAPKCSKTPTSKEFPKIVAHFKKQRDQFLNYLQNLQRQLESMELPSGGKKKDSKECPKCRGPGSAAGGKKPKSGKGSNQSAAKRRAAGGDATPAARAKARPATRKPSDNDEAVDVYRQDTDESDYHHESEINLTTRNR